MLAFAYLLVLLVRAAGLMYKMRPASGGGEATLPIAFYELRIRNSGAGGDSYALLALLTYLLEFYALLALLTYLLESYACFALLTYLLESYACLLLLTY